MGSRVLITAGWYYLCKFIYLIRDAPRALDLHLLFIV